MTYKQWGRVCDRILMIPALHYTMESAVHVKQAIEEYKPDCIAVELIETFQQSFHHAAMRLPDISVVSIEAKEPLYYLCEPCDPAFEALRSAIEKSLPSYCIDLDQDVPPSTALLPDPYAIQRVGLMPYFFAYEQRFSRKIEEVDKKRHEHMARRLKELNFSYERILFVCGMDHVTPIYDLLQSTRFTTHEPLVRGAAQLCTLTDSSAREVMAGWGFLTLQYEDWRRRVHSSPIPDRQKIILNLYQKSHAILKEESSFLSHWLMTCMRFAHRLALQRNHLVPDLFQILTAAKGCVDHRFAYEVWKLATDYPPLINVDNLPALTLNAEQIWGHSKKIQFHLKAPSRKQWQSFEKRREKANSKVTFKPPSPWSLCSYPKEDVVIESFARHLLKKGTHIEMEQTIKSVPFTTSLEDGIDVKETIRHFSQSQLFVKTSKRPQGLPGAVVVIFDNDEKDAFPWKMTWHGEHNQESDMAFYATSMTQNVVGPGISSCQYGGFLMSYPPQRLLDIWHDPDYSFCKNKAEVLLMAAIDYSLQTQIVYAAATAPTPLFRRIAARYGKKIIYHPIGQMNKATLKKIQSFHVLDGHHKRLIADDYIF